jgi:uncharacterized protein
MLHNRSFDAGPCPTEGCSCEGEGSSIVWNDDFLPPIPEIVIFKPQNGQHLLGEEHTLTQANALFVQQCDASHWVVCHPTGEGKLAVLDDEAYRLLERFHSPQLLKDILAVETTPLATRVIELFINLGFLHAIDQPAFIPEQRETQTLSAWLHITNACNLSCDYCYVSKNSEHMSDDTAKRSIDAIIRSATAYHYQGIYLTFAGGEAILRLPEVILTYDYAEQQAQRYGLDLSASIISNGAAFPPRAIAQLRQRNIRVSISLDGVGMAHDQQRHFSNGQGSFPFVDRTITRLLKAELVPYINVTVTQRNLDDLPDLFAYLLQRDLPFGLSYYRDNDCSTHLSDLQFTDTHMINGMRAAFAYLEEYIPKRKLMGALIDKARTDSPQQYACGIGRHYMVIDQHGSVAKCQVDIRNTLTTINAHNPLQVIKADRNGVQATAIDDKESCHACEWRYWCRGGCPMLTYHLTGRSDIKSPNCTIYKALFPKALRLEALRLLKYYTPIIL